MLDPTNLFSRGIKALPAITCLLLGTLASAKPVEPVEPVEQDIIEAAMTLQILEFTEWPAPQPATKRIGVVNSEDSLVAFESLLAEPRYAGRYEIAAITAETPAEDLFRCHALFFSDPDPIETPRILHKLDNKPIALIGAYHDFFDVGGLVNLVKKQSRLGFEIQLDNSTRRGIEYRAKLLRLAARIVKE